MLVAKKEMRPYFDESNFNRHNKKTKTIRRKNNKQVLTKLKLFTSAVIVLLVCLAVLLRYAQVTQVKMDIASLDREINDLQKEKQELVMNLEQIKESGRIEKTAMEQLGMTYPTSDQTVFVEVENYPSSEAVAVADNSESDPAFLKAFGDMFNKIIEFIE